MTEDEVRQAMKSGTVLVSLSKTSVECQFVRVSRICVALEGNTYAGVYPLGSDRFHGRNWDELRPATAKDLLVLP